MPNDSLRLTKPRIAPARRQNANLAALQLDAGVGQTTRIIRRMNEYLLLMHAGAPAEARGTVDAAHTWPAYFARLRAAGAFEGGSAIGGGVCVSKAGRAAGITGHLAGYLRVRAESLAAAEALVAGNPVYEAGGTVEIRELPRG